MLTQSADNRIFFPVKPKCVRWVLPTSWTFFFFNKLDWGPVPLFASWKHCSQCGLLYDSPFSKCSYFGRQVSLASTTCGSPPAARGGTMGEKWWPNGAWDMHPGFFYMPQICDMGPIILLPFRRKAC